MTVILKDAGFQLEQVFLGMPEAAVDRKLSPNGMSPREILQHLTECYLAFQEESRGEKHDWGTYKAPDTAWEALHRSWAEARAESARIAQETDDPNLQAKAIELLALHDAYHVGQLSLIRLDVEPDWNMYSIYGM